MTVGRRRQTGAAGARVPPGLHFVATPIGAARDITLRALDVLAGADVLAAEDTRTLRHLMEIHGLAARRPAAAGLSRPQRRRGAARGCCARWRRASRWPMRRRPARRWSPTPASSWRRAAIAAGLPVLAAPGASAVLCALTVSGLPTDRFLFAGFPPPGPGARGAVPARARRRAGDADPLRIAASASADC